MMTCKEWPTPQFPVYLLAFQHWQYIATCSSSRGEFSMGWKIAESIFVDWNLPTVHAGPSGHLPNPERPRT